MNNKKSVHVATGVWYKIGYGHKRCHHFPCHMQYDRYSIGNTKFISALEGCEPVAKGWVADYDKLNGAKPRPTRELIDLTKNVCADFITDAKLFAKIDGKEISLPMVSISMQRLVNGATCYQGNKGYMDIKQDYNQGIYNFVYSVVNCLVTPSNVSDVLGKNIEHIHVVNWDGILWNQKSKLDPNASLYVYNYDKYDIDGGIYVRILEPDTEVVNRNLCLISPKQTRHIPTQMAELFRQKTAPIRYRAQSR